MREFPELGNKEKSDNIKLKEEQKRKLAEEAEREKDMEKARLDKLLKRQLEREEQERVAEEARKLEAEEAWKKAEQALRKKIEAEIAEKAELQRAELEKECQRLREQLIYTFRNKITEKSKQETRIDIKNAETAKREENGRQQVKEPEIIDLAIDDYPEPIDYQEPQGSEKQTQEPEMMDIMEDPSEKPDIEQANEIERLTQGNSTEQVEEVKLEPYTTTLAEPVRMDLQFGDIDFYDVPEYGTDLPLSPAQIPPTQEEELTSTINTPRIPCHTRDTADSKGNSDQTKSELPNSMRTPTPVPSSPQSDYDSGEFYKKGSKDFTEVLTRKQKKTRRQRKSTK